MKPSHVLFALALPLALVPLGCAKATKVATPAHRNVPAQWKWQAPTPPVPPMAYVQAGAFRKEERTRASVDTIVIHTTEGGWKDERTHVENQNAAFAGNVNYFKGNDRQVSAHFVMGPNGEICAMVDEGDVAHTQTYYNARAFGIECAGWSSRPETWTPELLDSLVDLCAYLCVKWEIPAYHPEGTAWEGPHSTIAEDGQYRFNGTGLVGHFQVQPWNKSDPGEHFPWEEFCERVQAKIREYGIEPIELPPARPALPEGTTVSASISPDTVAGEGSKLVYTFVVEGPGVGAIPAEDFRFPDFAKDRPLSDASEPMLEEHTDNRVVYQVKMVASGDRGFSVISPKVKIGGEWYDGGTAKVKSAPKPATE